MCLSFLRKLKPDFIYIRSGDGMLGNREITFQTRFVLCYSQCNNCWASSFTTLELATSVDAGDGGGGVCWLSTNHRVWHSLFSNLLLDMAIQVLSIPCRIPCRIPFSSSYPAVFFGFHLNSSAANRAFCRFCAGHDHLLSIFF
jgi:hypothetical protein